MSPVSLSMMLDNLEDAREQIDELIRDLGSETSEEELQTCFEHAFHHLCFAWNARNAPAERLAELSTADFNAWSQFPADLKPYARETANRKR